MCTRMRKDQDLTFKRGSDIGSRDMHMYICLRESEMNHIEGCHVCVLYNDIKTLLLIIFPSSRNSMDHSI